MSRGNGGTGHVPVELLDRYAAGGSGLGADVVWTVEVHLEGCAGCRARLGRAVTRQSPDTVALLERVRAGLGAGVADGPRMPARRRWLSGWARWWATPALLPRVAMTVLVVLVAVASTWPTGWPAGFHRWCCWRRWRRCWRWRRRFGDSPTERGYSEIMRRHREGTR